MNKRYTYCFNNPANMNDDEGEMSITLKKKAASLGITMGILLIALKALGVVATPYIAIGVIAFAVGYLGYKVYKRAKGQKTKKKTAKKVEKKRRAMHLIGLKGRNIILKSLQIEMLVMFLIRSMAKETIKQVRIPNIVK